VLLGVSAIDDTKAYEVQKGPRGNPEAFKKVVPDALSAEDWFRFHNRYADGTPIAT
jgi:hypothetical protein